MLKKNETRTLISDATKMLVAEAHELAKEQNVLRVHSILAMGAAHCLDYGLLGLKEVGIVIVGFNPNSHFRYLVEQIGCFGSVDEAEQNGNCHAKEIRMYMQFLYGVANGNGREYRKYSTPLEYSHERINGFFQCKVTRDGVYECFSRAERIHPSLPVNELRQLARDMEAVKRFFGEKTIDSAKKPDHDVMMGIPLIDVMGRIKMMSREQVQIVLNWDKGIVEQLGPTAQQASEIQTKKLDGKKVEYLSLNDYWHQARAEIMPIIKETAAKLMEVTGQRLPEEEVREIVKAARKYRDVVRSLNLLKSAIWHSTKEALLQREKEVSRKYGARSYRAETWAKEAKSQRNELYPYLRNQARLICELGGINDPIERVRCALVTVLFDNGVVTSTISWDKLSIFVSVVLDIEWQIYKLFLEEGNPDTPQETKNRVTITMNVEDITAIDGEVAMFESGSVWGDDGEEIMFADSNRLNGEFILRVEKDEAGKDVVYACKNIISILKAMIPKADSSQVLFITDERTNVEKFASYVKGHELILAPTQRDAILCVNDGKAVEVGKFRCVDHFENNKPVNSKITTMLYGGNNGYRGTVTNIIRGFYQSNRGRQEVAVCLIQKGNVLSDTEAEVVAADDKVDFQPPKKITIKNAPVNLDGFF